VGSRGKRAGALALFALLAGAGAAGAVVVAHVSFEFAGEKTIAGTVQKSCGVVQ
jgi:hypothetical protein